METIYLSNKSEIKVFLCTLLFSILFTIFWCDLAVDMHEATTDHPPVVTKIIRVQPDTPATQIDSRDVLVLSSALQIECGGEDYHHQLCVGSVVLNRIKHKEFPNSLYGVLTDSKYGKQYPNFRVLDPSKISESCKKAAIELLTNGSILPPYVIFQTTEILPGKKIYLSVDNISTPGKTYFQY